MRDAMAYLEASPEDQAVMDAVASDADRLATDRLQYAVAHGFHNGWSPRG